MTQLQGASTVVTGASRGMGRGIAIALGAAGATVYVSGRSVRGEPTTDGMPGTIEETAELVTDSGGQGIAVRCDHSLDSEVETLFARINEEQGHLDLLVNNVWGGYEGWALANWQAPFWEEPLRWWRGMFTAGVRAHYMASRFAVPLMLPEGRGLIVNISASNAGKYLDSVVYDVSKKAIDQLAWAMAHDLREHNMAAVSLHPGFARTEAVETHYRNDPSLAERFGDLKDVTHSPQYTGRAVVALASDPNVMEKSGGTFLVGKLALEYGFTDIDGRQPQWPRDVA